MAVDLPLAPGRERKRNKTNGGRVVRRVKLLSVYLTPCFYYTVRSLKFLQAAQGHPLSATAVSTQYVMDSPYHRAPSQEVPSKA